MSLGKVRVLSAPSSPSKRTYSASFSQSLMGDKDCDPTDESGCSDSDEIESSLEFSEAELLEFSELLISPSDAEEEVLDLDSDDNRLRFLVFPDVFLLFLAEEYLLLRAETSGMPGLWHSRRSTKSAVSSCHWNR